MTELIKVIATSDELKLVMREHVAEVTADKKVVANISQSLNRTNIIIDDNEGNYFQIDTENAIKYILVNKLKLIEQYKKSKE